MYCSKCGNQLKEGEIFCPKCGAKVGSKTKFPIFAVIIAVLVTIICIMILNFVIISKKFKGNNREIKKNIEENTIIESSENVKENINETIMQTSAQVATQAPTQASTQVATQTPTQMPIQIPTQTSTQAQGIVSFTPPISGMVETTPVVQNISTTETTKKGAEDGKVEVAPTENQGPGVYIAPTSAKSVVTDPEVVSNKSTEVKVKTTTKITDSIDDDEHTCNITLLMPVMQGKNDEETEGLNSSIEELMDMFMEDVENIAYEYDELPKKIVFTQASLTSTTKANIFISLTGTITQRNNSTKSIKYRIVYDREEQTAEINKV